MTASNRDRTGEVALAFAQFRIDFYLNSGRSGHSGHSCFFTEHLTTFTAHFGHCPVIPGDSW